MLKRLQTLFPSLLILLVMLLVAAGFLHLRQQRGLWEAEHRVLESELLDLQAGMEGLQEANQVLHARLQQMREDEKKRVLSSAPEGPTMAMDENPASRAQTSGRDDPSATYTPVKPSREQPQISTWNPSGPSPQLRQMAAQFPGLDLDAGAAMNQPNVIQRYIDANPTIFEDVNRTWEPLRFGIEAVLEHHPDMGPETP